MTITLKTHNFMANMIKKDLISLNLISHKLITGDKNYWHKSKVINDLVKINIHVNNYYNSSKFKLYRKTPLLVPGWGVAIFKYIYLFNFLLR